MKNMKGMKVFDRILHVPLGTSWLV